MMGTLQVQSSSLSFCGNCSKCLKCRPENYQHQQLLGANSRQDNIPFCGNCGNCIKCRPGLIAQSCPQSSQAVPVLPPNANTSSNSFPTSVMPSSSLQQASATQQQPGQGQSSLFSITSSSLSMSQGLSATQTGKLSPSSQVRMLFGTGPNVVPLPHTQNPPGGLQGNGNPQILPTVSSTASVWQPNFRFPPAPYFPPPILPPPPPPLCSMPPRSAPSLPPFQIASNPPIPPAWDNSYKEAIVNLIKTPFTKSRVSPDSNEYCVLSRMIGHLVGILQMDRIVNPDLWLKFTNTRRELMRSKSKDWELLTDLGLPEDEVHQRVQLGMTASTEVLGSDYSDNVALLFHCTRSPVDEILMEGLDERLGRANGLLGKGIYFTDDPVKAISYDKKSTLFVFLVFLGDCLEVDKHGEKVRQNYVREPRKHADQRRNVMDTHYDSIMGRPLSTNEFVIFNRQQCYPLYSVEYKMGVNAMVNLSEDYFAFNRKFIPPFVWKPESAWQAQLGMAQPPIGQPHAWPFYAQSLFSSMEGVDEVQPEAVPEIRAGVTGDEEECPICCTDYDNGPGNWQVLDCNHKICTQCHASLKSSGATMSGVLHTWVKCPFCLACSGGLEIGSCPDGSMTVATLPPGEFAAGYEGYEALRIFYSVPSSPGPGLNRLAYIPKTPEGEKVVKLLRIAWDRRLCFSVGTSMTTGQANVLVWNIHHKTSLRAGSHGYPDSTYLNRVQHELAQYNIK